MRRVAAGVCGVAACTLVLGCSSAGSGASDGGPGVSDDACAPYVSDADLTAPSVTFMSVIAPLFQQNCATAGSVCHGDPKVTGQGRPFLGLPDAGTDAAEITSGIVGVASFEDPAMEIVAPGEPAASYMMHKVDGDQCTLAAACAKGQSTYPTCGMQMPYESEPLDVATRDTIRRWIAQGAK